MGIPGGGGLGGSKKRMQSYQQQNPAMQQPPPEGSPMPVDGPVARSRGGPGGGPGSGNPIPPQQHPAVRHEDPPPRPLPPPPRPEDEGTDMSLYEMPDGQHVSWDDQQVGGYAPQQQAPQFDFASGASQPASPSFLDRIKSMPTWGWLLIALGLVVVGIVVGFSVKGKLAAAAAAMPR